MVLGAERSDAREGAGGTVGGETPWKDRCEIVLSQAPGISKGVVLFPSSLRQETE